MSWAKYDRDVRVWHEAANPGCPPNCGYWGITGHAADMAEPTQMTHLYGPAVRRKRFSSRWR
jgi:hypothetical protein